MIVKNILESILKDETFLPFYLQAMSTLNQSGVLDFLKEHGSVKAIHPSSVNYVDAQAAAANQAIGYNECLSDLIYFKERFLTQNSDPTAGRKMDFGGIDRLVESNDLTKEEADALRQNKPVPSLKSTIIPTAAASTKSG